MSIGINLICGRSRAGKTTYSKQFEDVIHLDNYGSAPNSYPRVLKKVADAEGKVVVEGIYDTAGLRTELLKAYRGNGKKVCTWINTPLDIIESRFHPRFKPRSLPHPFEPPTYSEGWDEIIIIGEQYGEPN